MTTVTQGDLEILTSHVGGSWAADRDRHLDGEVHDDIDPTHPATPVAWVRFADHAVVQRALGAADSARQDWSRSTGADRSDVLHRAAALLRERSADIGRDIAREMGKTLAESVAETERAAQVFRYFAGQALEPDGETYPSSSRTALLYARRMPMGVVTVITPWNFPVAIPAWKIAPALAYANTVIWKPSEIVPLTSVHLMQALIDAGLPDGVLNLVLGTGPELGTAMTTDPRVAAVTFTGSNTVGRSILRDATEAGKRVQLEMGGKNPAVVLADADLEFSAASLARAAFLSAGQKCTATSRVIVEESVAGELGRLLAQAADSMVVGDPLDPAVQMGPVVSARQHASVRRYLELGRDQGRMLTSRRVQDLGGGDLGDGYFVAPTVFSDLPENSPLTTEEVFGPVVVLQTASSYEQCVDLANDTSFGLAASVYTSSLDKALRFAEDAQTGVVKVNQETSGIDLVAPFGGVKHSAFGPQEQGKAAREFFTRWHTVYLDRVR